MAPSPINFGLWALAVGLGYGMVIKAENEPWDGWDYAMILVLTYFARKGLSEVM
jgi:hypothetical protein